MDVAEPILELGLTGAAYAAPVSGGPGVGFNEHELVSPASVMKVQIALTIENLSKRGKIDASMPRLVPAVPRTPGPTGMSLMSDDVTISIRDLVVAMLTISDNVATDDLIALAGLEEINRTTRELGLEQTKIVSDVCQMLDDIAHEVGFEDFNALSAHNPETDGHPSSAESAARIESSAALDPSRGSRTTAFETVSLLQAIWTDRAGDPGACQTVRRCMESQLTRNRIASGFDASVKVAAKSGALLRVVRNEAAVVELPGGPTIAIAVFTRKTDDNKTNPAVIDHAIGRVARLLVDEISRT